METWRQIKGYTSPKYYISNLGRVYVDGKRKQFLKPQKHKSTSSLQVRLFDGVNRKYKKHNIKGLMREYFKFEFIKYLDDDEECKELKDYPGYFITTKGRVWSSFTQKFKTIHPHHRYYHQLCVGKRGNTHQIHKLVGRTFLEDYKPGLIILHKDETLPYPDIHFLNNLWVGTYQDNVDDMIQKGRDNFKGKLKSSLD
jgi:hypothetical protein